jgi:ribosomal protein L15
MAEEGSIRQTRSELRRTRQRAPVSQSAKPVYAPTRRIIPEAPKPTQQVGARRADEVTSATRDRLLRRGGINVPIVNAVALNAGNQAQNAYREGLGTGDAFQDAVGAGGETRAPVLQTIPESYGAENEEEEAFAQQQARMKQAQEQFLPESTGLPTAGFENSEVSRRTRTRPTAPEGPPAGFQEQSARAAALQAAQLRSLAEAGAGEEEEEEEEESETVAQQRERIQKIISRGREAMEAVEAAVTVETILGAVGGIFLLLFELNASLISMRLRRGSLFRWLFPAAQFPYEAAFIASADIGLFAMLFLSLAITVGPMFFIFALATGGLSLSGFSLFGGS